MINVLKGLEFQFIKKWLLAVNIYNLANLLCSIVVDLFKGDWTSLLSAKACQSVSPYLFHSRIVDTSQISLLKTCSYCISL